MEDDDNEDYNIDNRNTEGDDKTAVLRFITKLWLLVDVQNLVKRCSLLNIGRSISLV